MSPHKHIRHYAKTLWLTFFTVFGLCSFFLIILMLNVNKTKDDRSEAIIQTVEEPSSDSLQETVSKLNWDILQLISEPTETQTLSTSREITQQSPLEKLLSERKTLMYQLMSEDPEFVLSLAEETADLRAQLPDPLKSQLESETQIEGDVQILVGDNLDTQDSSILYSIRTREGDTYQLNFVEEPPLFETDTKVRVTGPVLDDQMVVSPFPGKNIERLPVKKNVLAATVTSKVAVIMFNFQNDQSQPYTENDIRQITYTAVNNSGANAFYKENSFGTNQLEGQINPQGDIYGWYTIPYQNSSCNFENWKVSLDNLASSSGFNPSQYKSVIYLFPHTNACFFTGLSSMGGSPGQVWINGNYSAFSVSHELGHNFGLHHANTLNCTDANQNRVSISGTCTSSEYLDPFDAMGANGLFHFNSFHKGQAKYFESSNSLFVNTNGDFVISPNEITTGSTQTLIIPTNKRSNSNQPLFYYIDLRKRGLIFDQFAAVDPVVNGVSIHLGTAYDATSIEQSQLIDTTPLTAGFNDSALSAGRSFVDSAEGLTITTLGVSGSDATVRIGFAGNQCIRTTPLLTILPAEKWGYPGQSTQFNVFIQNRDSVACGSSAFTIQPSLPAGITQTPATLSVNLSPNQVGYYMSFSLNTNVSFSPGDYSFTQTISRAEDSLTANTSATLHIQANPNGTCVNQYGLSADFDNNGNVGLSDYTILINHLLMAVTRREDGDANCDGDVNLRDYTIFINELAQ